METPLSKHIKAVHQGAAWFRAAFWNQHPELAIITGTSGPKSLSKHFEPDSVELDLPADIFPQPRTEGHEHRVQFGSIRGVKVIVIKGRAHFWEEENDPYRPAVMARALGLWGVNNLALTNAAGGLDLSLRPGTICVVADHNSKHMGHSPLRGRHEDMPETFGLPHAPMNPVYDRKFNKLAAQVEYTSGTVVENARYVMVPGPEFETAMEADELKALGANIVGMSSIPEAMVWRAMANACIDGKLVKRPMRVMLLSLVTNRVPNQLLTDESAVTHESVQEFVAKKDEAFAGYLAGVIEMVGKDLRGEIKSSPEKRLRVSRLGR